MSGIANQQAPNQNLDVRMAQNLPSQPGGRLNPGTPSQGPATAPAQDQSLGPIINKDAPTWECKLTKVEGGPELNVLTVGAKFAMHCEGPTITPWVGVPALQFAKPEEEFSLAILNVDNAGANSADFVVTGYKPGEHSGLVSLGAGENQVRVTGVQWTIQTTVKAEQGQQPKPIPPFGPLYISWPMWLWISLATAILLIIGVIWWRLRRRLARKRLLDKIKSQSSVLSPYAQLHKDFRALLRRYEGFSRPDDEHKPEEYAAKLNESFRNYLSRQLLVPATEWSDAAIVRDIRKRHKSLYKRHGKELYGLLHELKRAQFSKRLSFTDCNQLHEMARKVTEKVENHKEAR